MTPGHGHLPLAVLRPLRRGLHLRQRRPDADARVDERRAGGGMSAAGERRWRRRPDRASPRPADRADLGAGHRDPGPDRDLRHRAGHPAGARQPAVVRPAPGERHPQCAGDADRAARVGLFRLRAPRSSASAGKRLSTARHIEGNPRIQLTWLAATTMIVLGLAVYGTIGPAQQHRGRRGWGRRSEPIVQARRCEECAGGPGDRPAVVVDVPLPGLRRGRDRPAGAAGRPGDRVPRDLARRRPQLLGGRARGEGRRDPRQRQRRLRQTRAGAARSRSAARSCAVSGTAR